MSVGRSMCRCIMGALTFLCASFTSAVAGDWSFIPKLSLEETYSNNVLLRKTGAEGDFITTVRPGISVRGKNARVKSSVDYGFQQSLYADKTELDNLNNQLLANTNIIFLDDWMAFDVKSRMSQQSIDNRGQISRNSRNQNNQRDVTSYEWGPQLNHKFGEWLIVDAKYFNQTVEQSQGDRIDSALTSTDSTEDVYEISISSGKRFERIPIRFTASDRNTEFGSGKRSQFQHQDIEVSYVWSRKFRFTATGGIENNQFDSIRSNTDGSFWMIGGTWTPSQRTSVSGSWGERFFGKVLNAKARHRHRRLNIVLDYSEDVVTSNQFERNLSLVPVFDAFGAPMLEPTTNDQILVPIDTPSVSDSAFVSKRLSANLSYSLLRSNINLRIFQTKSEYQSVAAVEVLRGVSIDLDHNISPRLSLVLGSMWRKSEFSRDDSVGKYFTIYPGIRYKIGPHSTAQLEYEYARNSGPNDFVRGGGGNVGAGGGGGGLDGLNNAIPRGEYTESSISATLHFHL